MPWFKVDDNLAFHHKVLAAGNPAMGLWVRAGSVSAQQLTDGFIPDHMIAALGTKAQAEKLVAVGLWDRAKGGYIFHEWAERQPSRVDVEAERAAAAERMRAHRERKRKASQKASPQVDGVRSPERTANFGVGSPEVRDVFGNPDPTRPDPTIEELPCASADAERATETDRFEEFWDTYGKKLDRKRAEQKWRRALKKPGVTADLLITAAASYVARQQAKGKHPEFTKNADTWLNGENWNDETDNVRPIRPDGQPVLPPLPPRSPFGGA